MTTSLATFAKLQRSLSIELSTIAGAEQAESYLQFIDAELEALDNDDASAYCEGPYLQYSEVMAGLDAEHGESLQLFLMNQQEAVEFMLEENEYN